MIRIFDDSGQLFQAAVSEFLGCAPATVVLSGGATPRELYRRLVSAPVLWEKMHFFWGDERHVPPGHPDSNYRMAYEVLLSQVPVPMERIHRIPAEDPQAEAAAREYEQDVQPFPFFDLVLLGMGTDGHTASLFPGSTALSESNRRVVAPWVQKLGAHRITMTPHALNQAALVIFLVTGEEKAEALHQVLEGEHQPERFPAQAIRPVNGKLLWMADRAAARLLKRRESQ